MSPPRVFKIGLRTSLVVQWLGLLVSMAGGAGLIRGWGITEATETKQPVAQDTAKARGYCQSPAK